MESIAINCFEQWLIQELRGDRIHGSIRKYQIPNFRKSLKEGHVYAIKDFIVQKQIDKYKTTTSQIKIMFYGKTHVFEMFDETFPRFMYNFTKFSDLADTNKVDDTMLIDIIGKVISMHSAQNKDINGRLTKFLDLTLEDLENNRITCTLWENYAEQIKPHLEQELFEPLVIILQMGRAKVFKGQVKVSNTFHVTKLLVNSKVAEIQEFKKSNNPTFSISHVSLPSARTAKDELEAPDASVKTVDYLYDCEKAGSFWICARVVSISEDWWYLACTNCGKKMHQAVDNFYCVKCDDLFHTGVLRYMITVQVVDESASATLLCWDRDWENLIGKSCTDLRREHLEEESSSESEVNTPIKNLKKRPSTSESPMCKRRLCEDFSSSTTSMKLKSVIKIEDEKDG
ncbi:hypothetical protein DH2020_028161 [Rehmannia glutinosa]|uniref:Uncharacterized protein n=1 Tax=Rehmannia glutinosa TaxID=99300 RepID=A0ABR0VT28_REHGL